MDVIGDAYSVDEVDEYVQTAREIQVSFPDAELGIVSKCQAAIDAIPEDLVLKYSRGYRKEFAVRGREVR